MTLPAFMVGLAFGVIIHELTDGVSALGVAAVILVLIVAREIDDHLADRAERRAVYRRWERIVGEHDWVHRQFRKADLGPRQVDRRG